MVDYYRLPKADKQGNFWLDVTKQAPAIFPVKGIKDKEGKYIAIMPDSPLTSGPGLAFYDTPAEALEAIRRKANG